MTTLMKIIEWQEAAGMEKTEYEAMLFCNVERSVISL
jgi:hypothetical protein